MNYKIQIRGEAEAYAISAKAKAEAEQMAKKAEAWREYREAAMVDMLLETLPKVNSQFILNEYLNNILYLRSPLKLLLYCLKLRKSPWCQLVAEKLALLN